MSVNKNWNIFLKKEVQKPAGIVVCLDDKQRFLVIRRSPSSRFAGQWTLPGGHIDDKDRSIEMGAIRELEEETDLVCLVGDLVYLGEPKPQKYYFYAKKWCGDVDVNIPNPETGEIEHDDFKWLSLDEVKDIENSEIPIYLLEKALEMSKNETNS